MIKFTELNALTNEHVELLNEQLLEKQSIREVLRCELGAKSVTKKVRDEVNKLNKKLQSAGYVLEEGVYEMKQQETKLDDEIKEEIDENQNKNKEEIQDNLDDSSNEDTELKSEDSEKKETKAKKKYTTKKQKAELEDQKKKELEEKLKENPFALVRDWEVLQTVDYIATAMVETGSKALGVYVNSEVEKAFEQLQKRFYYIPNYLLISTSIYLTCNNLEYFVNSKMSQEFIEKAYKFEKDNRDFRIKDTQKSIKFVEEKLNNLELESEEAKQSRAHLRELREELKERKKRKQTNVKTSVYVADTALALVQDKFPFLSKSDVVNLCVYSFSKCFNNV